ncbi:hypothetical protein TL16_g04363 [Triparma laevis f. inornata]|uniref:NADP-dependent oxidoreductase domain-containing protein n=1 Tax=Triparma laevis f. inornata TaxID=1714386 RepID=A0A9W7A588_9STRA|nr:hypothetical protein TL16_g04363 [Triparma laevis f. inornata]
MEEELLGRGDARQVVVRVKAVWRPGPGSALTPQDPLPIVGYRHIDTAESYGNEKSIGLAIKDCIASGIIKREDLTVTTKLWPGSLSLNFGSEKTYDQTIESCKNELNEMGLDYFDLYLIHGPFSSTRISQYSALIHLKSLNLVKKIGVSNYGVKELEEIKHLEKPHVNQIEVSPICRQSEELREYMSVNGIKVWAYGSLSLLSNWRSDSKIGKESFTESELSHLKKSREVVARVSSKMGKTEAQILLRWALEFDYCIVPKSTNETRMKENLEVTNCTISEEDMQALNELDMKMPMCWSFDPINIS